MKHPSTATKATRRRITAAKATKEEIKVATKISREKATTVTEVTDLTTMKVKIETGTATETETTIVVEVVAMIVAATEEANREITWIIEDLLAVANVSSTEGTIALATTILVADLVEETEVAEMAAETSKIIKEEVEATAVEAVVATTATTRTQIASEVETAVEMAVAKVALLDPSVKIVHLEAVRAATKAVEEEVASIELKLEIKKSPSRSASSLLAKTWSPPTSRAAS